MRTSARQSYRSYRDALRAILAADELGSIADQGHSAKELHIVYASLGSITALRRDAWFPDGTVRVEEVLLDAT